MRSRDAAVRGAALGLGTVLPSAGKILRFLGSGSAILYVLGATALIGAGARGRWLERAARSPRLERHGTLLSLVVLALCAAAFFVLHSHVDGGSDRDEALELAVRELVAGRPPYALRTWAGNPISPMPGELLLALPFVLLGLGGLQSVAWLAAWWGWLRLRHGAAAACAGLVFPLLLAPVLAHEVVTAGDLLANAIWVTLTTVLVARSPGRPTPTSLGAAALWGLGLSSRAHFLFVAPIALAAIARRASPRAALLHGGFAACAFLAVTVPVWALDPDGFTPLHTVGKLAVAEELFPGGRLVIIGASSVASLALVARRTSVELACAIAVGLPIVLTILAGTLVEGSTALERSSWYLVSSTFFGVLAVLGDVTRTSETRCT